jgi:hypothetical protein
MVADITSILRSGRTRFWASRVRARARSEVRLRSWNSSKITAATPSRVGSATRILVATPSVRTSMRVREETLLSKRIL